MKKTAKKLPLPESDFEINKKILEGDIISRERSNFDPIL